MSLKQSIVIVNEFSVKGKNGKGSRGSTPGNYVNSYMGRSDATESLYSDSNLNVSNFITNYMGRDSAVENFMKEVEDGEDYYPERKFKRKKEAKDKKDGVAFSEDSVSLTTKEMLDKSRQIQQAFDQGKTVLKTVLSFDEKYLKDNKIVDEDFKFKRRGDYKGNIDQLKLRHAIRNGISKMGFDDVSYAGVIQIDTAHVHCHLAMVDMGKGRLVKNGEQRGKIHESDKKKLRRGIDSYLDEHQKVKMLSKDVGLSRQNTKTNVKKFFYRQMSKNNSFQFLLTVLPKDKRLWRASTNRRDMVRANDLTRNMVENVFSKPNSGYNEAMLAISDYAGERYKREGLSEKEYRKLIDNGREKLVTDCMNSVYDVCKNIPSKDKKVHTDMLDVMSVDYDYIANLREREDDFIEFSFKLRTYGSRLDHHKREKNKYHSLSKDYLDEKEAGRVSEESEPMYNFYKIEEEYNRMLMAKYQHFLNFIPTEDEYDEDLEEILEYKGKINDLKAMKNDVSLKKMSKDKAEEFGLKVYDQHGGSFVKSNPEEIDRRIDLMNENYKGMKEEFLVKLEDNSLYFDEDNDKVINKINYDFNDVKALDLHHLDYDFLYDFSVSNNNIERFVDMADKRYEAYDSAYNYLVSSGQKDELELLPTKDVLLMKTYADKFKVDSYYESKIGSNDENYFKKQTISLDSDYQKRAEEAIINAINIENIELD